MAINVNGATPYQPITATKNKQTFKGSDVQSAPEQKEGGNALLWGSIAALGAAGLTYLATKHCDGKTLDAAKTQLKNTQEALTKNFTSTTKACEAIGFNEVDGIMKNEAGEVLNSVVKIAEGKGEVTFNQGKRASSVFNIENAAEKGKSSITYGATEDGSKLLTQTIEIEGKDPKYYQYTLDKATGKYNRVECEMKDNVITPLENAASKSVDAPEYALNVPVAKPAPTAQAPAQQSAAQASANQSTAQAQQSATQTAATSAQPATGAAKQPTTTTQAPAQQPATAAQTTAKASANQSTAAQQGTANAQNKKTAAQTQQLKNGTETQIFTPFENAYISKNLKIENGRLVGVNGNYTGNLNLTSKNKNTKYTLSFDEGRIVNVKTTSPKNGKSVSKNKIIVYNGNNVQVQTGGTNPIIATAKFDPATGTYKEVTTTINRQNNGSMDLQTFLTQVLRVS